MKEGFIEDLYDTLRGFGIPQARVEGIENLFAPGQECEKLYAQMLDAYEHLRDRLGVEDEDADIEVIISSLMRIEGIVSRRMYHYGALFGSENA